MPPQAIVIAGPNGSGKSTAARGLLPEDTTFFNADLIAQDLSGTSNAPGDIGAGRVLLARLHVLERLRDDFAFETTLAPRVLARRIARWREDGYQTHLLFFRLPSPELSIARVALRVQDGGHHVPDAVVRRRFEAGLRNFFSLYAPLVDRWRMYDNSELTPHPIARGGGSEVRRIEDQDVWRDLVERYGLDWQRERWTNEMSSPNG